MHTFIDEDEFEVVISHRPCTACGNGRKCNGRCNGSSGWSLVRRPAGEVAKIKAERQRKREDAILAEAELIRRRRA